MNFYIINNILQIKLILERVSMASLKLISRLKLVILLTTIWQLQAADDDHLSVTQTSHTIRDTLRRNRIPQITGNTLSYENTPQYNIKKQEDDYCPAQSRPSPVPSPRFYPRAEYVRPPHKWNTIDVGTIVLSATVLIYYSYVKLSKLHLLKYFTQFRDTFTSNKFCLAVLIIRVNKKSFFPHH